MQARDGSTNVIWSKFSDLFGKFEYHQKFENHLKFLPGKFVQGRVSVGTSAGFVSMSSPRSPQVFWRFNKVAKSLEEKQCKYEIGYEWN